MESCEGEGYVTVGMQFMADLKLVCEDCGQALSGPRPQVTYQGKNVHDILTMTVDDALSFSPRSPGANPPATIRRLLAKLQPLHDVGLGYVALGQGSTP